MSKIREIREGLQYVGVDERPIFRLTTTPWGSAPSSVEVKAYEKSGDSYTDVTNSVFPTGSAQVSGDVITLPALTPQSEGDVYRIEVKFTCNSTVFEAYAQVQIER